MDRSRTAIVTGCSSGIGRALTSALLDDGWFVAGLARRDPGFDHEQFVFHRFDLSRVRELEEFAERELAPLLADPQAGRIALVNNAAGIGSLARLSRTDPVALDTLFAVNATAPIYLMGFCAARVDPERTLRIVNVSSGAAHSPFPGLGDYSATKAALRLAGRTLAAELEYDGRAAARAAVFSYEPGVVATDMQVAARERDPEEFPAQPAFRSFHEQGQLHEPEAVVRDIVEFLAGEPDAHFTESRFGD